MPKLIHFCRGNIENGVERYVPEKPYYVRGATLDGRFMTKYGSMLVLADDNGFVTHYGKDLPKAIAFFIEKKIGWNFGRYDSKFTKEEAPAEAKEAPTTTTLASGAVVTDKKDGTVIVTPPVGPENVELRISASGATLNPTDGATLGGATAQPLPDLTPVTEPVLSMNPLKPEEPKAEEKPVEPTEEAPKKKGKKK